MRASDPQWDPLGHRVPLPFSATVFPLGFRLDLRSTDETIIAIARDSWPGKELDHRKPQLTLTVFANGSERSLPATGPVRYRAFAKCLSAVLDEKNLAVADLQNGHITAWIQTELFNRRLFLRKELLEGVVYQTLCSLYLTPVHAACVSLNGNGVLLSGTPGSGKSSLAYALARHGFDFVSDDVSYLLRDQPRRILGRPHWIRLKPGAQAMFNLIGDNPVDTEGVAELRTDTQLGLRCVSTCQMKALVFLGDAPLDESLTRLAPQDAYRRLLVDLPAEQPDVSAQQTQTLARITQDGGFTLGRDVLETQICRISSLLS